LIGLFFCLSSAVLDYIDGTIARKRGIKSKLGGWLDATLDLIWQNLLLCAIVYGVFISKEQNILWLIVGFFAIIGVVVSNHMGSEYNRTFGLDLYADSLSLIRNSKENKGATFTDKLFVNIITPTNFLFILFFTIRYFIVIGALFNIMNIVLCAITIFSITKAIVLFYIYILFFQYRDGKKVGHLALIKVFDTYYHTIKKRKET
jgi:phosphatidylglycerophosphate synthase